MDISYKSLPQDQWKTFEESDMDLEPNHCIKCSERKILKASLVVMIIINAMMVIRYSWQQLTDISYKPVPADYARVNDLDVVWRRFWWNTAYSTPNRTSNDVYWDAIMPAHGVVAVEKDYAEAMHWPRSLSQPGDESKMTYLLEGYHQIHCLHILRKTFWEAVDGRPFTHQPSLHMEHCFDTLRQSVQCYADNTPLYSFGNFKAGDGQLHRCRDWDQLRGWATDHTACYRDSVEEISLGDHFGFCDDGSDGVGKIDEGVGGI